MRRDQLLRMKELVNLLNKASKAYYQEDREIMTNYEYDQLYDELNILERETGIILGNSPTKQVGYKILSSLPKEKHKVRMLSLDKTKEIGTLKEWLKDKRGILSWKLDGLTIVLTYQNGELVKAITRGNGEVGEVITENAKLFTNLPITIPYKEELIIRGEAVIKYSDFQRINDQIESSEKYKNPRNLCSGTVRQLNSEITAKRNVHFFAFQIVQAQDVDFKDSKVQQLNWLENLGFETVEYLIVDKNNIEENVTKLENRITENDFGSDGLVLTFESISYSNSLGSTSKFPKHSIAFKWSDEIKETKLIDIEWSASRTGLINPIALFEPVELEGTTVSRASVHNISILEQLGLAKGDTIEVYKANMIIPQIANNLTRSGMEKLPDQCPACGGETKVKKIKDVKVLYCTNEQCSAKKIKSLIHFVSRDAMNIEGLSEATLLKFVDRGYIKTYSDIYKLEQHKEEIVNMEGFGVKSYNNLIRSIEKSKEVPLPNFIYALGINNVGLNTAKLLSKYFNYNLESIMNATKEALIDIEGFGTIITTSVFDYFNKEENLNIINDLLHYLNIEKVEIDEQGNILDGINFVITGSLEKYENRNELKAYIEALGGKVTGSVTNKTNYLINNNVESNSSKNKKAKELNIPIINEDTFNTLIK